MLILEKIRWKNFLSTGNNWTEINLRKSNTTLIVGSNGSGKSTMVDAISYALFGKPHRKIKIPQLVNSINKKDMVVEIEFMVNDSQYLVRRGLKPVKFEIWRDDVMINQNSNSKKYQKILEQNILKHNHKTFGHVEVLSSSRFVAFMKLSAWHRREVVEDLLDINLISRMNVVRKQKMDELKNRINDNEHEIELIEIKIGQQKKYIAEVKKLTGTFIDERRRTIEETEQRIESLQNDIVEQGTINIHPLRESKQKTQDTIDQIKSYATQFDKKKKDLEKQINFFENNDECPTCEQRIEEERRITKVLSANKRIERLTEGKEKTNSELAVLVQISSDIQKQIDEELIKSTKITSLKDTVKEHQSRLKELRQELSKIENEDKSVSDAESKLQNYLSQKEQLLKVKYNYGEEKEYWLVIQELLKDTGIKTKIIKQYLPVMNKYLNNYLQVLDFFVHFELDESFKETIRSRHRDTFSYDSFSEGEKQRIDLALLFTWRQVAKRKNSVSTNLLVLDETFDSSLDAEGVENLMKILHTIDSNTNVFVISHKPEVMQEKFERTLVFTKNRNFSEYEERND